MKKLLLTIFVILIILLVSLAFDLGACDTWVALRDATARGVLLFAKNSDRLVFDCQPLMLHPRQKWPAGVSIDLGRIVIVQVAETYATLGSSPYWCWGYEEGMNEYGVIIGNEGVFTKPLLEQVAASRSGRRPSPGLTGMDLVRLGLERAKTARQAVDVISGLVEKHGQFGSGLPTQDVEGAYDNSYLIGDSKEAWVLETADRQWIAKKIIRGVASISNTLSLKTEWDLASSGIEKYATAKGWMRSMPGQSFDFAKAYAADSPEFQAARQRALTRANCSLDLLRQKAGRVDEPWMMRIARDRSTSPSLDLDVTASSCVAVLPKGSGEIPVFWWCASVPTSGVFVPFFVHGSKLPAIVSAAGTLGKKVVPPEKAAPDRFSADSYWWLFRDLAEKVNFAWPARQKAVRADFDALENEFAAGLPAVLDQAAALRKGGKAAQAAQILDDYSAACVTKAVAKVNELRIRFEAEAAPASPGTESLIGVYVANFGTYSEADWAISAREGRLFLEIPGRSPLELRAPNAEGVWKLLLTDQAGVSFLWDHQHGVTAMKFHQGPSVFELPKKGVVLPPAIPLERLQKYLGSYYGEKLKETMEVVIKNNALALKIPGAKTYELRQPNAEGKWLFRVSDVAAVSFEEKPSGEVLSLTYYEGGATLIYKKVKPGSDD